MSTMVREHIVKEVGESFYTLKADGTRDPTGRENISIVVRFVNERNEAIERLLTIATAEKGDAATLTDTIIGELTKAGLSPEKILSQVSLVCFSHPHDSHTLSNPIQYYLYIAHFPTPW